MSMKVYKSSDASAPRLSGTAGDLAALLKACLIDGYGALTPPGNWTSYGVTNNKIALKSTATGASACWLHVDDSAGINAQCALIRAYDSLTGLDVNGDPDGSTGQFPTLAQQATSAWKKSDSTDTQAVPWTLFADEQFFYLVIEVDTNGTTHTVTGVCAVYLFGSIVPSKTDDAYHCIVGAGSSTAVGGLATGHYDDVINKVAGAYTETNSHVWIARRYDQTGGGVSTHLLGDYSATSSNIIGSAGGTYPNWPDNSLGLSSLRLLESTARYTRGTLPGVYQPLHNRPLTNGATISGLSGFAGRTLYAFYFPGTGEVIFDGTGPWR